MHKCIGEGEGMLQYSKLKEASVSKNILWTSIYLQLLSVIQTSLRSSSNGQLLCANRGSLQDKMGHFKKTDNSSLVIACPDNHQ